MVNHQAHDLDDPMSGGTQLAVADDDDLDRVPLEATPITLLQTDMANLSVDELLLDYDDLKVKPIASDCMLSPLSLVSHPVSNFIGNRCKPPYERAWRSDRHL